MIKKKIFDINDSNIENIGSDQDKKLRLEAAKTEKAWTNAGKEPGLQIWRIEKFEVKSSTTPVGHFYSDDSYIILNTYLKPPSEKLKWDVHFWIGKTSSQDEYGTAAYKTVELDDYLGGDPVQHREVQNYESNLFLSYFEKTGGIRLLEGGIESGFNHVEPESYEPRLLHVKGRKNVRVTQVPLKADSINEGDVFILDAGLHIYEWAGKSAGKNEKVRSGIVTRAIKDEREGKAEIHKYTQGDDDEGEFWEALGEDKPDEINPEAVGDEDWEKDNKSVLLQLSDASGTLEFKEVASGPKIKRSLLDSDDVFIFDIGCEVFVWIGKGSSKNERKKALHYAQQYLVQYDRPHHLPITRILDGGENEVFESSFSSKGIKDDGQLPSMFRKADYKEAPMEIPSDVKPTGKKWKRPKDKGSPKDRPTMFQDKPLPDKPLERPKDLKTKGKKWKRPAPKPDDQVPSLFQYAMGEKKDTL